VIKDSDLQTCLPLCEYYHRSFMRQTCFGQGG
jgi:hypothetical protein